MSLDERFRHTVSDALAGVQTRLQSEFDTTLGELRVAVARERDDVLAQAEAARTAAVAEARDTLQRELRDAFDAEKASLAEAHAAALERTATEAERTLAQLRTEAEQAHAQLRTEAEHAYAQLREEAEQVQQRLRAEAEATVDAIRGELREAQAAAVQQRDEYEQAAAQAAAAHDAEVARLGDALASASGERDELRAVLTRLQEEHAAAGASTEQTLALLRGEAEAALAEARAHAEAAHATLRAEAEGATTKLSRNLELQQSSGMRLLETVRALDGAASLPEVLDALAGGVGKEAGRAAVLVVKGDRLIGWRSTGFGMVDDDPRAIQLGTSDPGALSAAVHNGRAAHTGHGATHAAPPFSQMEGTASGLAVPLLVAAKTVAVVYAEAGTSDAALGWTAPVELLARHAGRCIEALAVQRPSHARASGVRVSVPA